MAKEKETKKNQTKKKTTTGTKKNGKKEKTTTGIDERIRIFTDGACSGNPGPGGFAAVILMKDKAKSISGNATKTTNNRMELKAVIEGLKEAYDLGIKEVDVCSDSAYVVNAITQGWLKSWKINEWKTKQDYPVKNKSLWVKLDKLLQKMDVRFTKVKGHSGIYFNEMADSLAVEECKKAVRKLVKGEGYENIKVEQSN